ncbi:FAD/NAD(P)-binding domain-containing protein [Pyrenochaeta sp. DS3sAY3a]|nr:FAD/NAD(P)-binding domain-containing protein [Pyrenochaeta sp. DS3sAY3a]
MASLANGHDWRNEKSLSLDCLVVGGGFGGLYTLYKLREKGLNAKVFEAGSALGGVWYWNRYPGARVDSEVPYYQYSLHKVWKDWSWTERFPADGELRAYFKHAADKMEVNDHIKFQESIVDCTWDASGKSWKVKTKQGTTIRCRYLVAAAGSSYKIHYPDIPGLDSYKGILLHAANFPEGGVDFTGKKVAVIGQGATGIQITQELSKVTKELVVFIRTPNTAFPMRQRKMTEDEQNQYKTLYELIFKTARKSAAGLPYGADGKALKDVSKEERETRWDELWARGGFNFTIGGYSDILFDKKANNIMYQYWRKHVLARIKNPEKQTIMAPEVPHHPIATKRPSLEQDYYESIDRDNVTLVSVKDNPIIEITEDGVTTKDGKNYNVDAIIFATGYDAVTGSYTGMGLKDVNGVDLKKKWENGVRTHLGLTVPGLPNMFMVYSPQAPTALANGTTIIECQADWVADAIEKMREEGIKTIEAQSDAAEKWSEAIQEMNRKTLFWYMGDNIPGKKREQLNYLAGVGQYEKECREALANWDGFSLTK